MVNSNDTPPDLRLLGQIKAFEKLASHEDILRANGATSEFKKAILGKTIIPKRMTEAVERMMQEIDHAYHSNKISSEQLSSLAASIAKMKGEHPQTEEQHIRCYEKFGWFKTIFKRTSEIEGEKSF